VKSTRHSPILRCAARNNYSDEAQEVIGGTADQFSQLVSRDFAKFGRLAKELNIGVE